MVTDNDVLVVDDGSNGEREWVHEDADFLGGDLTTRRSWPTPSPPRPTW
ncbi:hypothetical protein [Haloarcula salinisoli]|nr:hypothetical protein [Halomicroarcula salinisoli]